MVVFVGKQVGLMVLSRFIGVGDNRESEWRNFTKRRARVVFRGTRCKKIHAARERPLRHWIS